MELKTRGYADQAGKRTTLRFDPETWEAIDLIAGRNGMNWAQWVHGVPAQYENRHIDVRSAVVSGLLEINRPRIRPGDLITSVQAPLLSEAITMTDEEFAADLVEADTFIDEFGTKDFGGFKLRVGFGHGSSCIWIENLLRGKPHLVIPFPEILKKMIVFNAAEKAAQT